MGLSPNVSVLDKPLNKPHEVSSMNSFHSSPRPVYEASISYNVVQRGDDVTVNSATKVVEYMKSAFEATPMQESFWVILLNRKNHAINRVRITLGTATSALAHPREIFMPAILANATSIICAHSCRSSHYGEDRSLFSPAPPSSTTLVRSWPRPLPAICNSYIICHCWNFEF